MNTLVEQCVEKDVSAWTKGYKALPLDFIDGPNDPLCKTFGSLIELNLMHYIEQMGDDGTWDITWNWGSYPKAFEVARKQWKGIIAFQRYKQLKAFGYLDF